MNTNLDTLEIQILLKCYEKPVNRTYITRTFFRHKIDDREKALSKLIESNLIISRKMPKPGAAKIPIFYQITDEGKKWISNYLEHYPT